MLDVFRNVKHAELTGLIVWVPMVPGDSALEAAELVSSEKRFAMQAWDSRRSIGEVMSKTLGLACPAWDVYLVYKPGVRWTDELPPVPSFWMHQLQKKWGANPAQYLQPDRLQYEVRKALGVQVDPEPLSKPEKICQ